MGPYGLLEPRPRTPSYSLPGDRVMFTSLFLKILNKEASSAKSKPEKIIASLDIREGYVIADIGSGGGYFTLVFARKTGKTGRVYAVDVKPKYLDFIRRAAARAGERAIRGPYQETFSIKLTFT